jgi:starvation-inducible outer membrane lipoprotein
MTTTQTAERIYRSTHAGHVVEIQRHLDRLAYARNGNVHNPSRYYRWEARVDGKVVTTSSRSKRYAMEVANLYIDSGEVDGI